MVRRNSRRRFTGGGGDMDGRMDGSMNNGTTDPSVNGWRSYGWWC